MCEIEALKATVGGRMTDRNRDGAVAGHPAPPGGGRNSVGRHALQRIGTLTLHGRDRELNPFSIRFWLFNLTVGLMVGAVVLQPLWRTSGSPDQAGRSVSSDLLVSPAPQGRAAECSGLWVEELRAETEKEGFPPEVCGPYRTATRLRDDGRYDEAVPLFEGVIETLQRIMGADDPVLAETIHDLAVLYYYKGDDARAEPLSRRALAIQERVPEPEHSRIAASLNLQALICFNRGEFAKAEPLFQRALAIKERSLKGDHPSLAYYLNNLARLYQNGGNYEKAEQLYQRAVTIRENGLAPDHPLLAQSLFDLANLYYDSGEKTKAELLHRRALAIRERSLGPEHQYVAESLSELANLYRDRKDYVKARTLYQRALAIQKLTEKRHRPVLAITLFNLARLYVKTGEPVKAEHLFQRALDIFENSLGAEHYRVAAVLNHLAALYAAKGESALAIKCQARANAIRERNLLLNLSTGSERQKLAYLATFSKETDFTLSLQSRAAPNDPQALDLAFTTLLRRKGRGLDTMADTIAALRRHATPEDQRLLDRLAESRARLATLALKDAGPIKEPLYQAQLKPLEEKIEELESALSARSSKFRAEIQPVTLAAVQSALPDDSVLLEFAVYTPRNLKTGRRNPPRYLAYLLSKCGGPKWADLGPAAPIDRIINAWRGALRNPMRADVRQLGRWVDELVMQPVRFQLSQMPGETRQLLIAPDGLLNLIPFAALVDRQSQYLVERYTLSYLTSGRDLLRLRSSEPNPNPALIVANPSFGQVGTTARPAQLAGNSSTDDDGTGGEAGNSIAIFFSPLLGTEREAQAISDLLPGASKLLGEEATEAALKQIHAPSILHIATHGFFLNDRKTPPPETPDSPGKDPLRASERRLGEWVARIKNPLLRSGLALAGANEQRSGDHEDGVLTALEAASLDLWGTKLVVLSACDTGLGEVRNGEGVYGLRRALVLAGSETQVMSLWPVMDEEIHNFMVGYYRRLLKGERRNDALRQIQLEMIKGRKTGHPHYWANFIQAGEWANLAGRR